MKIYRTLGLIVVALLSTVIRAQNPQNSLPVLNVNSMDKSIDPCVDFFEYSCGGWIKKNPIPPDQTSWSVYSKLEDDNKLILRDIWSARPKPIPAAVQPIRRLAIITPPAWMRARLRRLESRRSGRNWSGSRI